MDAEKRRDNQRYREVPSVILSGGPFTAKQQTYEPENQYGVETVQNDIGHVIDPGVQARYFMIEGQGQHGKRMIVTEIEL
jgi:hypothetical protein